MATKKYLSLERLTEYDALIKAAIANAVSDKAPASHDHDDKYYTETEINTKIDTVNSTIKTHTDNATIHVTSDNKTQWNSAYTHSTSAHAPSDAERNIIVGIQKNGTDITVDSNRKVNITVPTTAAEIGAATDTHKHDELYDAKDSAANALTSAKAYADEKIANLLENSTEAVDSIYELRDAMNENADAIEALETIAASKASKTEFDTHASDTTKHITATERTNWGAAYTHSQAAHAPSDAEKNQNAFSNVKVGSTTVAADSATDTFEIAAGVGISVAGDATNDKVTITNSGVIAVSTGSANGTISVNTNGTSADVAIKGLGSAAYTAATDYATHDHVHTIDADFSSTSTNPVQNKVVNNAITTLTSAVGANTSSINTHSTAISDLQTAVSAIQEITSAEIRALFA